MTRTIKPTRNDRVTQRLRLLGWALVAALLVTPAVAMRFTAEVQWTTSDFVFAGVILIGAGVVAELAVRASSDWSYRIGAGLAVLASVLLVWINGAVGIIGSEDNPANLLYLAVIAAVFIGAVATRFRAEGLARVMICAAVLQVLIGAVAVMQQWMTVGGLIASNMLAVKALQPVAGLVSNWRSLAIAAEAAKRLEKVLAEPVEQPVQEVELPQPQGLLGLGHLFSLPGLGIAAVMAAVAARRRRARPWMAFAAGLAACSIGFAVAQIVACRSLMYCGALPGKIG